MFGKLLFGCSKAAIAVGIMIVALMPTWVWLAAYNLIDPTTWWARLLTIGVGLFFLGVIQVVCLVFGTALIFAALIND